MKKTSLKFGLLLGGLICVMASAGAQEQQPGKTRKIEILHANSLVYNKKINPDVRRFIGDVKFKHNEFIMYCDSAYSYTGQNKIDAFSNVHITRGDTLHLYGDYLSYNGNTNLGKVRRNVKLKDPQASLYTDSLNFYSGRNYAYYFNGGKIINQDKTITSREGHYYSDRNMAHFKDSVKIKDPDYRVHADTLNYNTKTEIAYFFGPTRIYSDENYLYCENGWYKTIPNQFFFRKNALYQKNDRIIKGDTLYYDDSLGYGEIRSNAEIRDTTKDIILRGNYSEYTDEPEKAYMTDSAHMIAVDKESDSLYLHADTLRSLMDSTGEHRLFKAYYQVKIFKSNMQGKCDSLTFAQRDSIIRMYRDPVIWSDSTQITADFIKIYTRNNNVRKFELEESAFMVSMEDTGRFNQIKGNNMTGYFRENQLRRVLVNGNGQTIYYAKDKENVVGVNKAISSNLRIKLLDNQVISVTLLNEPEGTLHPVGNLKEDQLSGFQWLMGQKPKSKYDIFKKDQLMRPEKKKSEKKKSEEQEAAEQEATSKAAPPASGR